MRTALARDFSAVPGMKVVISIDHRIAPEPGPWQAVVVRPGAESATFLDLARSTDLTLPVAPESSGILADLSRTALNAGRRTIGCRPDAIALAADKHACGIHLERLGIATPRTYLVHRDSEPPADWPFPSILKPKDGAGGDQTWLVHSRDQLRKRLDGSEVDGGVDFVLQPYIKGAVHSVALLRSTSGGILPLSYNTQRIRFEDGRPRLLGITVAGLGIAGLPEEFARAVEIPGLVGYVGIDYIRTPDGPILLEINPRPTTSYVPLTAARGSGRVAAAWLDMVGDSVAPTTQSPKRCRPVHFRIDDGSLHDVS